MDDPHPWFGERWMTELTFSGFMDDDPELEEEDIFEKSVHCSAQNWPHMNVKPKKKFLMYASWDKKAQLKRAKQTTEFFPRRSQQNKKCRST